MKRGRLTSMSALRLMAVLGFSVLAGCLGVENQISQKTVLASPDASRPVSSLAVTEITGMPDAAATRLRTHLKAELANRGIALVEQSQKAAYNLKGFTSTASNAKGTTLVTVWEVLDKKGRRTHRIIGEETGPVSPAKDPWAGVNSAMLSALAVNLARDYKTWSTGRPAAPRRPAIADLFRKPVKKPPIRIASSAPVVTGSIPAKATKVARRTISVLPLTGAPGDGNTALAVALKTALGQSGYKVMPAGQKALYSISAQVHISQPKDGKQDLAIDWKVKDARNRQIGMISQRNRVKANALGQQWGATAQGAATAAASHIVKLLR